MLKKISRLLLLGLMVCAGSACVTPTHASSAPLLQSTEGGVLLTHIYPATADGALYELVALYNNTDTEIDITDWCVMNKNDHPLTCFSDPERNRYFIEARGSIALVSEEYVSAVPLAEDGVYDYIFTTASKSSGSLVGSNDTVRIKDSVGRIVDEWGWSSAATKGYGYVRDGFDEDALLYSSESIFTHAPIEEVFGGGLYTEMGDSVEDEAPGMGEGVGVALFLNEVLPNPLGADKGNEFIEIYNQGDGLVRLDGYTLHITGGASDKTYRFPEGAYIEAGGYYVLTNTAVRFSLNNTAGALRLLYTSGGIVTQVVDSVEYSNPTEGQSWSLFATSTGQAWHYTATPTPGAKNVKTIQTVVSKATTKKPCNADQFRNPATGRCKKKPVPKVPTPCKAGQYRSKETGRCRKVATAKTLAPCKPGQERNSETNRCRNIKKMTSAGHGVEPIGAKETPGGLAWYAWLAVGGIVLGVLAYGAWEWRHEINMLWQRVRKQVRP